MFALSLFRLNLNKKKNLVFMHRTVQIKCIYLVHDYQPLEIFSYVIAAQ